MSNKRVSAIILNQEKVLLVHRLKDGREYYVLPGGSVESNETNKEALTREVKEETGLDVEIDRELWQVNNNQDPRTQHVFLIKTFSGGLKMGQPETDRQSADNKYFLEWHELSELKNLNFFPEEIKGKISQTLSGASIVG